MKLTKNQRERYSRLLALRNISEEDMESIMNTTVAVVGAGGLGSPALRLLAAIGFGKIRIIDRDIVELSNIQRQTVYNTQDIDKPKAEAAAANLALMNPEVEFEPFCVSVQDENAVDLLRGSDIIVDGLDSFKTRKIVNRASLELQIPFIFAGAVEYYANLSTFIPGQTGCFSCVMGNAEDNPENTCANIGVSPTLLSLTASVQVNDAILIAIGKEPLLANRLMTIDSETLSFDFFDISQSKKCPDCSGPVRQVQKNSTVDVTLLCSQSYNVSPSSVEEIDLQKVAKGLSKSYSVKSMGRFLVISLPTGERITLMSSGSVIIKGVNTAEDAVRLYEKIRNIKS